MNPLIEKLLVKNIGVKIMTKQPPEIYRFEGIHPRCKTLYDAIKMRYNGLNIKDFEIKDIK